MSFAHDALGSTSRQILLLLYGTRIWDGVAAAQEAGSAIIWVDAEELAGLAMPPLDIPLAQAVIPLLGACQR
jgi:8-oxo-dGTP diphosphatase